MSQTTEPNDRATNYHIIDDYARSQVVFHTKRAGKRLGLKRTDREDFAHGLLLALCKAAPEFDPAVASSTTFVGHVVHHAALHQMRTLERARNCSVRNAATMTDCDDDSLEQVKCPRSADQERHDVRTDVRFAVEKLPRRTGSVARLLMTSTQAEAARALGISRQALNGHVMAMRHGAVGSLLRSAC